jgi:hypothetical protein
MGRRKNAGAGFRVLGFMLSGVKDAGNRAGTEVDACHIQAVGKGSTQVETICPYSSGLWVDSG